MAECAGVNQFGELLQGSTSSQSGVWSSNVLLPAIAWVGTPIRRLNCGAGFCSAEPSTGENTMYCVGRDIRNDTYDRALPVPQPVALQGLKQARRVARIVSGYSWTCALLSAPGSASSVQCWGNVYYRGAAGVVEISGVDTAVELASNSDFTMVVA
jgi:hypothetical protein